MFGRAGLGGFGGDRLGQPGDGSGMGSGSGMGGGMGCGMSGDIGASLGGAMGGGLGGAGGQNAAFPNLATGALPGMGGLHHMGGAGGMCNMPEVSDDLSPGGRVAMYDNWIAYFDHLRMGDKRRGAQRLLAMIQADPENFVQTFQMLSGSPVAKRTVQDLTMRCEIILGNGVSGSGGGGTDNVMGSGHSCSGLEGGGFSRMGASGRGHSSPGFGGPLSAVASQAEFPSESAFGGLGAASYEYLDAASRCRRPRGFRGFGNSGYF